MRVTHAEPAFPPLFRGEAAPPGVSPLAKAIAAAARGTDPGLIVYRTEHDRLCAAVVLAPEAPLEDAMAMVFAASLGFGDALGALAPPEVGVHFDWPAGLRVNGAKCGRIHAAASHRIGDKEPEWLVVGIDIPLFPPDDGPEPGDNPDRTSLVEEGCGNILPARLLESWSRHMLVWINRWLEEGMAPLHSDWRTRAYSIGEDVTVDFCDPPRNGTFVGLDEKGGMLLRDGGETLLIPLSRMLEMT
ncbi:MAG: DUF4444 domain-containing protein [Paracoccaceae bacterium]